MSVFELTGATDRTGDIDIDTTYGFVHDMRTGVSNVLPVFKTSAGTYSIE